MNVICMACHSLVELCDQFASDFADTYTAMGTN